MAKPNWGVPKLKHYVREWREARGLTQEDLAQAVGRTKSAISKVENGSRQISQAWFGPLANVLGIRVGDLFNPPKLMPDQLDTKPENGSLDRETMRRSIVAALSLAEGRSFDHGKIAKMALDIYDAQMGNNSEADSAS
jgi:transcriptional regulator with XRE-family HTH domain